MKRRFLVLAAPFLFGAVPVHAEIAVSANDGKHPDPGIALVDHRPDNVSVIDLGRYPPKLLGSVAAPASLMGPPLTVAVAPDESFALVAAARKVDPANPIRLVSDDALSVIDLRSPSHPRLVQSLHAGMGAAGIAINRAATLALVSDMDDDTVSVFSIAGGRLAPVAKIQFDPHAAPTSVVFTPDGKAALVACEGASRVVRLTVNGTEVTKTGIAIDTGRKPYGLVINAGGTVAIAANLEGRGLSAGPSEGKHKMGTLSVIDLKSNKVAHIVDIGIEPEHVAFSGDGAYVEATVSNGSHDSKTAPGYHDFGLMKVLRLQGTSLVPVAETRTGHWCQGAVWSRDDRLVLLQCALEQHIEVYRFDGKTLVRDPAATIGLDGRPSAIATSISR